MTQEEFNKLKAGDIVENTVNDFSVNILYVTYTDGHLHFVGIESFSGREHRGWTPRNWRLKKAEERYDFVC